MRLDNFINVAGIYIGVPDRFRVHHGYRPARTAVKATRLVDAHLAWSRQPRRLDLRFAAVEAFLGAVVGAAFFAALALVQAEKNMPFVVRACGRLVRVGHGVRCF